MNMLFRESFERLKLYCENEGYKGWDPYDGLMSKVFQSVPFVRNNRFFKLAWIQFFKKSPVNFRRVAIVPKSYNAKGLGLFLTGYCNLHKTHPSEGNLKHINFVAEKIIELQATGYSGSCWGYYFDWQARAFFQPANTPTVVATSFVADALFNAYELTKNERYKAVAVSSADFVLNDLNRTYDERGSFAFSYSPLDNTQVFNASLLGARLLSRVYYYTHDEQLKQEAGKAMQFVCDHQRPNGAWAYGTLPFHSWIDNFHTGFNLECMHDYEVYTGDKQFDKNIEAGFQYYVDTFFTAEGASRYYHNQLYPIDIHSPAQLVVTLVKLGRFNEYQQLAEKVLDWTVRNMQSKEGFFYYQRKKLASSRIPYMRWAQAWMFYAMSYYLMAEKNKHE